MRRTRTRRQSDGGRQQVERRMREGQFGYCFLVKKSPLRFYLCRARTVPCSKMCLYGALSSLLDSSPLWSGWLAVSTLASPPLRYLIPSVSIGEI